MDANNNSILLSEAMKRYKLQWKQRDKSKLKIVNRRKVKLFEMIENKDEYFSEESIKARDPVLYEMYIGWRSNITSSKSYNNNPRKDMWTFLLSQMDKETFKENLGKALMNDIMVYGKDNVIEELSQVNEVNSNTDSKREDDADELIRLMFIQFLYSAEAFPCDNDSEYDYDNDADRFDEDNYFNSDNDDLE